MKAGNDLAIAYRAERRTLRRTYYLVLLVSFLQVFASCSLLAQNSEGDWLTGARADAFLELMSQGPYAQAGDHGMVVYTITYSSCGNCTAFLRDFWDSRRADVQLREIFSSVSQPRYPSL